jgi:basic membrane protein A
MKKLLVGTLVALLVLTQFMLPVIPAALAATPTDIADSWAKNDIQKLVDKGYISGYPDGTFLPNNMVTRAEFLKIITGVLGYPEPAPAGASPYSDVAMTDWFFKYVISAGQNNLVGGYPDGTFQPNNPITRQEVAKILSVAQGARTIPEGDKPAIINNVPDWASISEWAQPYVMAVLSTSLMKGDPSGNFRPLGNMTRAETAVVGVRLLPAEGAIKVGLVTDVGGRGDKSFNDSALRGLEQWAGGADLSTVPADLASQNITSLGVTPVVLESKASEDYIPNLTKLAKDEQCNLVVAVGFMLADAVKEVAPQFPDTKFMLIDSTVDPLPANVVCYLFKENEGSFLVGALAAQMTKTNVLGFVGGMEVPLIKKFEAGYKAGIMTINNTFQVVANYTGNFSSADDGKKAAVSQFGQNADIIYAAAGACGIGVIQAAKDKGEGFYAIGVDSDQDYMAPGRVLTSMIKHVDLAVYLACKSVVTNTFQSTVITLGVKEGGVNYSPLTYTKDIIPASAIAKVDALKGMIAAGTFQVPTTLEELATFTPPVVP